MKKYYAIILLAISPMFALAQSEIQYRDEAPNTVIAKKIDKTYDYKSSGNAFWMEDFGNGFPADWAVDNPGGLCPWKWSLNGSHGYWNGTNAAGYADSIASTTAGNGFLIADNDSANHFNFGQPSGTTYQYIDTYFITSAIDLSAHPAVKLEFEQNFRYNNDVPLEVMVSNDSTNWTTWFVQGSASNNVESDNPDLVSINISSVAGGQSTVYLKIGWSARVYFWMIDDMRIVEAPQHDIRVDGVYYNEWDFNTAPDFGDLEYSIYPQNQTRPLNFKSIFTNNGVAPQTGVQMDLTVTDPGSNVIFNTTEMLLNPLPADATDSLSVQANNWSGYGRYTADFTISADSMDFNPSDNVGQRWYELSEFTFARDTGALDGRYDNQGEAYELGNWYNIQNGSELLYGIDVAIDDASAVGTTIYGIIYDSNRDPIEETEEYEIQASDLNAGGGNTFVTLPFSTPVDLFDGEDYLVMAGHYGGPDNVEIGTSGISLAQTSLIWDVPVATWFYVTRTPMVRMNLNPAVGIEDLAFENGMRLDQNYPNPFDGISQITFEVNKSMDVTFEVHDITGKVVQFSDLGKVVPGVHTIQVDANELGDGVYFYSIRTDEHSLTKRMVVLGDR